MYALRTVQYDTGTTSDQGPPNGDRRLIDVDINVLAEEQDLVSTLDRSSVGLETSLTPPVGSAAAASFSKSPNTSLLRSPKKAKESEPVKTKEMSVKTMRRVLDETRGRGGAVGCVRGLGFTVNGSGLCFGLM